MALSGITGQGGIRDNSYFLHPTSSSQQQALLRKGIGDRAEQQAVADRRAQEASEARRISREKVVQEVERSLRELEKVNLPLHHKLKYHVNQNNEVLVKIIDTGTNKVIKELPAVAIQRFHKRFREFIGLFINKEV